ncbi:hypothetical protein SB749_14600 [Brevibacterium sp. SIMBA_078]
MCTTSKWPSTPYLVAAYVASPGVGWTDAAEVALRAHSIADRHFRLRPA